MYIVISDLDSTKCDAEYNHLSIYLDSMSQQDVEDEIEEWKEENEVTDWFISEADGLADYFVSDGALNDDLWEWNDNGYDESVNIAAVQLQMESDEVDERYRSTFSSDIEFAQEHYFITMDQTDLSIWPFSHIDWESAAEDLMDDYLECDGHYFYNL